MLALDGERYRWVVSSSDLPNLRFVIEAEDVNGQRVVVGVDDGSVITPALVSRAVAEALRAGWTPQERGPQLHFRLEGEQFVPHGVGGGWPA